MKTLKITLVILGFIGLLLLGLRADTRSVQRDSYALDEMTKLQQQINLLNSAVDTNQKAIIQLQN